MSMTDEELYERFLKRQDEADIRVLFERHKEGLLLFINGFVHNLDDAEELMIDTFAQVVAGRTLFSRRSAFSRTVTTRAATATTISAATAKNTPP